MIPRATYRLQFRKEFTFENACRIVPYLAELGISHVYASPILAARQGSPHGYDVVDHARINAELGGENAFRSFVAKLKSHGLGLIVDIVPNHMAVGPENAWWMDVLEHGRESRHAENFDIDWDTPDPSLTNKVLLPILAAPLEEVLTRGDLQLAPEGAKPSLRYGDHRLPLRPEDARDVRGTSLDRWRDPHALASLVHRQHYRLAWWRVAGDAINWRRFFDINDLIALRVEDDRVFERVHAKHFELFADGLVDGFRVDHVDGLADPRAYCRRLRRRLTGLSSRRAYLVVEKILAPGETLPGDWETDGTTGYDFMNDVAALLHDPAGARPLSESWARISGWPTDYEAEEREARRRILDIKFRGAFQATLRAFRRVFASARDDLTHASLERAFARLFIELRIYRTYSTGEQGPPPGKLFEQAVARALCRAPANDARALRLIVAAVNGGGQEDERLRPDALRRFNQLAASLAAKADEDTAYYRYGRLLSRNEVGSDPGRFAMTPGEFHHRASQRRSYAPLLATATHDHKRGEDVRARLAVLSEISDEWANAVARWFSCNTNLRGTQIERSDEYQLYQTLVGSWPFELGCDDESGLQRYAERIAGWRVKSLREAKRRTSWSDPDPAFEDANLQFVRELLDSKCSPDFLRDIAAFVERLAPPALLNSLAQCVLKCTAPGVPDFYQGAEFWDFSLVDPDNRRAVDYAAREDALARDVRPAALLSRWRSGALKQSVIAHLLELRAQHEGCFSNGEYLPLEPNGCRRDHVVSFVRSTANARILVVTPRGCGRACIDAGRMHPAAAFWGDTVVDVPIARRVSQAWRSVFGARMFEGRTLACAELFAEFPVAVLVAD